MSAPDYIEGQGVPRAIWYMNPDGTWKEPRAHPEWMDQIRPTPGVTYTDATEVVMRPSTGSIISGSGLSHDEQAWEEELDSKGGSE